MATDLPQLVIGELRAFIRPLTQVGESDDQALALQRFVRSCGWSPPAAVDPDPIVSLVAGLEEAFAAVEADLVPDSLAEAVARIELIAGLIESVRSIGESVATLSTSGSLASDALGAFSADVASRLAFAWLEEKRPLIDVATMTGLVEYTDVAASEGGSLTRPAGRRPQLRADLLSSFLSEPVERVTAVFAPDGWDEPEGAVLTNLLLRSAIGPLIKSLGGHWMVDPDLLRRGDEIAQLGRQSVVVLPLAPAAGAQVTSFAVELEFLSRADRTASGARGPAVLLTPHGTFASHADAGGWSIDYTGSLLIGGSEPTELPALTIGSSGVEAAAGLSALLDLQATRPLDLVIGSGRSGLTLGEIRLGAFGAVDDGAADFGFSLMAADSSIGISSADFGSIVSSILSFDLSLPFDLGLEWSREAGLRLAGAASLELQLSSGFDLGIVAFGDTRLVFDLNGQFAIDVTTEVTIVIGPVTMSFYGVGGRITLSLGELDLQLALVSPTRLVITITSEAVNGGGFLEIDPENGRYAGGLALDIVGFGISAIVIVDTEVPGGGWALFASLGLTFPSPIPIGFGFTLLGVGGLLALNRTLDVDALAEDLSTGAADSILFPDNLLEDADAVLAGLDDWFPLKDASTVVGPVVKIGWGSPTLITAQLGVVITLPDLIIALLGSVEVLLPSPEAPLLSLRMDILGAVDLPASTIMLAASLHDSNLLGIFELSGDMGFYAQLSGQPLFVLSIGGYHPQFDPPGALPCWLLDLRKTQAAVALGENVEVVLTSYVAVTSNSFQFGGRFTLEASVKVLLTTYTAEGWFGINVLLVLKPFKLVASASAGVSISAGDKELFGVDLAARLEGPQPWYSTGRASFTFFGFDVEFGFEVGTRPGGEPREICDVATDVVTALSQLPAWEPAAPADAWASGVVMTAELPEGLWVRPDQVVVARQSIAPLNRTMTAFGEFVPEIDRIDASDVTIGEEPVAAPEWLEDWFAPAQFDRLDDTTRLSSPSYELMTAGVRLGDDGIGISDDPEADFTEVSRIPEESIFPDGETKSKGYVSAPRPLAGAGAVRTVLGDRITVAPTAYTVVRKADGARADLVLSDAGSPSSIPYAEATAILAERTPAERSRLKVTPAHAAVEMQPA